MERSKWHGLVSIRLGVALLLLGVVPFLGLLFLLLRAGYSWPVSLLLAGIFPVGLTVSVVLKVRTGLARLRGAADQPIESPQTMDEAVAWLIEKGYLSREEVERSKADATIRVKALMEWFNAEFDKANTDADRARVVEELERRVKSAQPASSRPRA